MFEILKRAATVMVKILTGHWDIDIFIGIASTLQEIYPPEGVPRLPQMDGGFLEKLLQNGLQTIWTKTRGIILACTGVGKNINFCAD